MRAKFLFIIICVVLNTLSASEVDGIEEILDIQIENLTVAERKTLDKTNVIIKGDIIFVEADTILNSELSRVVISKKLIPDGKERYLISHLIRNILIDGAVIYNYDDEGSDFRLEPIVNVSDDFIIAHKKDIINVLYYLLHKDYFDLYSKQQGAGDKIFNSEYLKLIKKDVIRLKKRLIKEKGIMPISDVI